MSSVRSDEPWTQLATRVPKGLHHRVKLHCIRTDVSVMQFVVDAIEAKLRRPDRTKRPPR